MLIFCQIMLQLLSHAFNSLCNKAGMLDSLVLLMTVEDVENVDKPPEVLH